MRIERKIDEDAIRVSDQLGISHSLPHIPELSFVNYDEVTQKIPTVNSDLNDYHQTTKYRMDIAVYCLKLIIDNYDNSVVFAAGLTGFLVQGKACLDSLCQEINLYYGLSLRPPPRAADTEDILKESSLQALSGRNSNLSQFLRDDLKSSDNWFCNFVDLRDKEGTHRKRGPRLLRVGVPAHDIEIDNVKVAEFCVDSIGRINKTTEGCYGFM
ncbi:MAG: hypothetical protein ACHQ03_10050 [Candidatus Bathyarchaeia archaeon]